MSRIEGMIAAHRFGLGPAPGEIDRIAADPRWWLKQQVTAPPQIPPAMAGLAPSSEHVVDWLDAYLISVAELVRRIRTSYRALYGREARARLAAAIESPEPFRERLVWFWGDHFTVSGNKATVIGMAGSYEREAIRPHVTGKFRDMLQAAIAHPAMLFYLDNISSTGEQAPANTYLGRGLNENLAREILELHTLGVDGGYSQADVRELAKILTGWTIIGGYGGDQAGSFLFRNDRHEPDAKILLGQTYEQGGVEEGKAALDWLAQQPATARHVARKLARHFIADDPPASAISKLVEVFLRTEGDLQEVTLALIDLPEVWGTELRKLKAPQEYVVSVMRALGGEPDLDDLMATLESFGHLPLMAPSPAGWPDVAEAWINPDSALRRARWSAHIAARAAGERDPMALVRDTIEPLAPPETLAAIADDASAEERLALLFASPTFQRR